jgi:hypothetical protein
VGRAGSPHLSQIDVADFEDDFGRETFGFTSKIIPLLSNAQKCASGVFVALYED